MSAADDPARPGWHAHPEHETVQRYWDGTRWTGEHRFALVAGATPTCEAAADAPWTQLSPWQAVGIAALAALLVFGAWMLHRAISVPPAISGSVSASCSVGAFSFRGKAHYESDGRRWRIRRYVYYFSGGGETPSLLRGFDRGLYNNVHVSVLNDGKPVGDAMRSPGDRRSGDLYREIADVTADRSQSTTVQFLAIFDRAASLLDFGIDPRCLATTPPLPEP